MQSVMILGRQPALGLAELESLYGADKIRPAGSQAAVVDVDPCLLAFDRLGGSTKFCKMLTTLETTSWKELEKFLLKVSPGHSERIPEGKLYLGLSLYGFKETTKRIEATALSIKKVIRKTGRPVRVVPNKASELNAAQVLHNQLTGPNGWELVFIRDGDSTIVAQTVKVQDIEAYTRRDRERPKRDAKVGMLPPKLAQIIINLAVGTLPVDKLESICEIPAGEPIPQPMLDKNVLDPFCGTGVILQEALLMGYGAYGTDLDDRMVSYATHNIEKWLVPEHNLELPIRIEAGDATSMNWQHDAALPFDFVACEGYLGRPFTSKPTVEVLAQTINDCNLILKKFLKNIYEQIPAGTRLCIGAPAWQTSSGSFRHLPLIDQISDLGYNRVSFEHAEASNLIYYRTDQIVARELIVLTKR